MFYFGTTDETKFHSIVDSYSEHSYASHRVPSGTSYQPPAQGQEHQLSGMDPRSNPFNRDSVLQPDSNMRQRSAQQHQQSTLYAAGGASGGTDYPQMFMAAPLGGFENSSEFLHSQQRQSGKDSEYARESHGSAMTTGSVVTPTVYPYRARAVFNYTASPEDPNEISFVKGEILEISDKSGKWWQARRANNEVGICPSNYVVLIDGDL